MVSQPVQHPGSAEDKAVLQAGGGVLAQYGGGRRRGEVDLRQLGGVLHQCSQRKLRPRQDDAAYKFLFPVDGHQGDGCVGRNDHQRPRTLSQCGHRAAEQFGTQLGAELLCGAVAALAEGSGPLVVISADTAISLMAVNGKQELVGGVILPGPQLSLAALVQNTAQLPQIDLSAPAPASVLGKNTAACLQNGFVLGTAGMLDGLADHFCAELGPETKFYATGNLPTAIRDACHTPILYRETLITDGLYCIWLRNRR